MKNKEWFASWFNTPFYHILYQHRDFDEAEKFIDCLMDKLGPLDNSTLLDLACGKGRHAYYLAKKGYKVKGVDLSSESIDSAQRDFRLENLSFCVHDMRLDMHDERFDYVFNFFTSFGYFDTLEDNKKVIEVMSNSLNSGGTLVIDFLNAVKAVQNIVSEEAKELNNISFEIERKLESKVLVKDIRFKHMNEEYHYQEKVQALRLSDFQSLIKNTDLSLQEIFGDYALNDFDETNSDRLIMVFKKA